VTLRKQYRLWVFEKRMLRTMCEEVTADWRKQHDEELRDLYFSTNTFRMIKVKENVMDRTCSTYMRQKINAYRNLVKNLKKTAPTWEG
jgi:hypothetical protein